MKKTIVVCGHGPGISDAVARKFGREGYQVAIVARNAERLAKAAEALTKAGVTAKAFPCDLSNPAAARGMIEQVHATLGPVSVIHWNTYGLGGGDIATAPVEELRQTFDVAVTGLIATVQAALPDLKEQKGAVLVTNGGFGFFSTQSDEMCVQFNTMSTGIANSARHKAVRLLHLRLGREGVYVGEVMVLGMVKGTAFDNGHATLEASAIADKFWEIFQGRREMSVNFS